MRMGSKGSDVTVLLLFVAIPQAVTTLNRIKSQSHDVIMILATCYDQQHGLPNCGTG